ncbi:MAG TPA: nucleotidyltransferase family protein [Pyrinomonadaceae bacterium]|nr:nucleotidyltransferase family protein [Pyrinomonadaceae bacterium]
MTEDLATDNADFKSDSNRVGAVILAAGSSSRMGRPKQTLQFQGTSLLRRVAIAALDATCRPVVVVTGADAELSRRELDQLEVREAFNPDWETGMGSSVRVGIEGLISIDPDVAATVLLLCDQPHVTSDVVANLLAAHHTTGRPVIASAYGESFGVPALFSRTLFTELTQLAGSSGAKEIIKRHASAVHFLPFPDGEVDVDTPNDFSSLVATTTG